MKKTVQHTVTKSQSKRIDIPAGTVIDCELKTDAELPKDLHGTRHAKSWYIDGVRKGGNLSLDE
jgi:hypothetical protein